MTAEQTPVDGLPSVDVRESVAVVTFNRPERLNTFDIDVIDVLVARLEALADDPQIRVVVLTGSGRAFCAGGDVGTMADPSGVDPAELTSRMVDLARVTTLLHDMPKITIAAVNGACAGAGLSFACACDLRVSAESAVFAAGFLRVGQSGDYGITWLLPRIVGPARARQILFGGARIDAATALTYGLVGSVEPDAELMSVVAATARDLSALAPSAVAALKANLDEPNRGLEAHLAVEARRFGETFVSPDSIAAVQTFLASRHARPT
ncbi:MAG: Enoyl-CoA hydratase [Aeromicrobium sp.]|nr:Enoyl-CoA hydratase [Aeromicrobium sp.]